jgi:hypothetical protein
MLSRALHARCSPAPPLSDPQAFWLPSQQSESKDLMQKPDSSTYCPASGKKLRLKDCVAVKFTRVREGEGGMYMDPVTLETFTNASKLVVIVPTGRTGGGRVAGGVKRLGGLCRVQEGCSRRHAARS